MCKRYLTWIRWDIFFSRVRVGVTPRVGGSAWEVCAAVVVSPCAVPFQTTVPALKWDPALSWDGNTRTKVKPRITPGWKYTHVSGTPHYPGMTVPAPKWDPPLKPGMAIPALKWDPVLSRHDSTRI